MKSSLVLIALFLGNVVLAAQPQELGHFKGLAFSSATLRNPLEIQGGTFVNCVASPSTLNDMTSCDVQNGAATVVGTEANALSVAFTRVVVLRTLGDTPSRVYYFRGDVQMMIGATLVKTVANLTLTLEDSAPDRVRGFIDLTDQYARTSLEAYRVQ